MLWVVLPTGISAITADKRVLLGSARDIRLPFLRLGCAASLWHWQKSQTEEACLRKAEDTIFRGSPQ